MNKYYVELDGFSIIKSNDVIYKDDLLLITDEYDREFYRVANNSDGNLTLRRVKSVSNTTSEAKNRYTLDGKSYYFENRLSKNQNINIFGVLLKVLDIKKEFNELEVETLDFKIAKAAYGVYERKEGLSIRDREKNGYLAEKYFNDQYDAIGYVAEERGKGRKVSL